MKTSHQQFEMLITYMEQHGDLSKPTTNARGRIVTLRHWEELTKLLNSDGSGDTKSTDKWKKVWSDFKNNTKKKAARLHRAASGTGGGPAVFAKLTEFEQRVLNLIGLQAATGLNVEEAGFPQINSTETEARPIESPVAVQSCTLIEGTEQWDQAGPSHRIHLAPPAALVTTPPHTNTDVIDEVVPLVPSSPHAVPDNLPSPSGRTHSHRQPVGTPRRRHRGSRLRRSPRTIMRPERSEEAAQHFLNSDEEWRNFRINQHNDNVRLREIELQVQQGWQAIAARAMDALDKIIDRYC